MCKETEAVASKPKLHFAFCHQLPERSFFWKGKQFFMCARCTGINLGYLAAPLFLFGIVQIPVIWAIILTLPTYIDGGIQAYFNIESTNSRRFITGLVSGIATLSLISHLGVFIGKQILLLIN